MNKEIKIMVEVQRYLSLISDKNKEIERYDKSIKFWKNDFLQKEKNITELNKKKFDIQKKIKENEILLSEIEEKLSKLDEQKYQVSSEKEVEAFETEILAEKDKRDSVEEFLIEKIDEVEELIKVLTSLQEEMVVSKKQVVKDINDLEEKIIKLKEQNLKDESSKNLLIDGLSSQLKSILSKLMKSKNGIIVGQVVGDVCKACNFQIPASLAFEAEDDTKLVKCTNCGRYIYKIK